MKVSIMEVPQARWWVYKGKSHLEMDDFWGTPISGNLQIVVNGAYLVVVLFGLSMG